MRRQFIPKHLERCRYACLKRRFTTGKSSLGANPHAEPTRRVDKWIERYPKFLQPTLETLRNAPASHVTAFLILHEFTAIIPLLGFAGSFHYFEWLPSYFAEGKWATQGMEKFGRYFRKKGWISSSDETEMEENINESSSDGTKIDSVFKYWQNSENTMRWTVELATAWAIVKVLLPLRVVLSVWWSPWFARWTVIPLRNAAKGLLVGASKKVPRA